MRLLADTHVLIWLAGGSPRLTASASSVLGDARSEPMFSVVSIWEIAIKFALRRPEFTLDPRVLRRALLDNGYVELDVTAQHVLATVGLPPIHKDPFDRLLIAQAIVEGVTLLTADATILRYPGPIQRV